MKLLILSQRDVRRLLPMRECIDLMADTLAALARGDGVQPLRSMMRLPTGILGLMPAYLNSSKALGIKVISVFPGNHGTEFDSHQGAVLLFEGDHGSVRAILDAGAVTAIRTAAVSGVATRLLARPEASDLAILGTGVQALTHLEAMLAVRPVKRVRVWTRTLEHARQFAAREAKKRGVPIEPTHTAEAAVRGADIICTTTSAREPVLRGAWVAAGAHINAVGSSVAVARELDTAAVVRSRLFVDRRESTVNEAGDFLTPKNEGAIGDDHIQGEVGDLVIGKISGRRSAEEITLFKSLGLAVEDVASARYVYEKAVAKGVGTAVEFGGEKFGGDKTRAPRGRKPTRRNAKGRRNVAKRRQGKP